MKKLLFALLCSGLWISALFGAVEKVTIMTGDDEEVFVYDKPVQLQALRLSSVIDNVIEDLAGETTVEIAIPLPLIDSAYWPKIFRCMQLAYATQHLEGEDKKNTQQELEDALTSDRSFLYALINALNYLDMPGLLDRALNLWLERYELTSFEAGDIIYDFPPYIQECLQKKLMNNLNEVLALDHQWPMKSPKILRGRIWDFPTGPISSVCYSPNGTHITSGSAYCIVRTWNTHSGKQVRTLFGHTDGIKSVCYSPDGKYIASGSFDGTVRIWDAHSGKHIRTLSGPISCVISVCYSSDSKYIAAGFDNRTIYIWDAHNGNYIRTLSSYTGKARSVCYSPDGKYIAAGCDNGTIRIWDAYSGKHIYMLNGYTDEASSVCYSPDGNFIASGSHDGIICIWDAHSYKHIRMLSGHTGLVLSVCYSKDSLMVISSSSDGTVRIWDTRNGNCLRILRGQTCWVPPIYYGRNPALSGCNDWINSVCSSPDGDYIASGSGDGAIRVWHIAHPLKGILAGSSYHQLKLLALACQKKSKKEPWSLNKHTTAEAFDAFSLEQQLKLVQHLPLKLAAYRSLMLRAYEHKNKLAFGAGIGALGALAWYYGRK